MKYLLALLVLVVTSAFADQPAPLPIEACRTSLPFGTPAVKKQVVSICRGSYFTVNDTSAKIPVYVSYVLSPAHATGCASRDNSFASDLSLPADSRASTEDYVKNGYDIGHMANAEDLKYSEEAQNTAAILTNAAPQLPGLNRGIWKKLEDTTRGWSLSRDHALMIYTGPVYRRATDATIGRGRVTVPHGFFKIIVDLSTSEVQVFLFKHEGSQADLGTFITSLAEVQKQTGVVFPMPANPQFTGLWPITVKSNLKAKAEACALQR
jgi:endonuclease G